MGRPFIGLCLGLGALVVLLAVLQWSWIGDLERAEIYRDSQQIGYATWLYKQILEREVELLVSSVGLWPITDSEGTSEVGERVLAWRAGARWPGLLGELFLVRIDEVSGGPLLARIEPEDGRVTSTPWPPGFEPMREALATDQANAGRASGYQIYPSLPALLLPSTSDSGPAALILQLDREYLTGTVFPELDAFVFAHPSFDPVEVTIAEPHSGEILYASSGLTDLAELGEIDTMRGLFSHGAEPADLTKLPALRPRATWRPRPLPANSSQSSEQMWLSELWREVFYTGHWQIYVRHGQTPILAKIASQRTRNAALAFGPLLLLGASVAILVVAARRRHQAAAEQLERMARVSHELRTPLAVLATAGENLSDAVVTDPDQLERYGRQIERETRRLGGIVENVLHLSRSRSGLFEEHREPVELVALAIDSVRSTRAALEDGSFAIEVEHPEGAVTVEGNRRALQSALLNLLSNAVKYGREGSWARVRVAAEGDEAQITVEDRGPGLPERDFSRLLEPYTRGDGAAKVEGSGLGLAVVKEVVDRHKGRISLSSSREGGASFTLHLPLVEPA